MLLLVVAHRHMRRPVGEDVRRHQHGVNVKPDAGVLAVLARLLLELRHAVQPADARHAVQNPGEFRVRVNLRLVENDVLLRVHARRDKSRRDLARGAPQIGRVLLDRDRVHIDDAIDAIVIILQRHEFRDRAEIVAEMQIAGRLDAGENALFHGFGSPDEQGAVMAAPGGNCKPGRRVIRRYAQAERGCASLSQPIAKRQALIISSPREYIWIFSIFIESGPRPHDFLFCP